MNTPAKNIWSYTKANLGCGFDRREGYLNVDLNGFHQPDLICDVTDLQPLPSGHFSHVLAYDVLEHIPRHRSRNALREWNRILRLGGCLEIQVPNVIGLLQLLQLQVNQSAERQEQLLQCLFGTQSYVGDYHYTGFTEITLRAMLDDCGFCVEQLGSRDEWMFVVTARKSEHRRIDPIYALSSEAFVDQVYQRLLDRTPDDAGRAHHVGLITSGVCKEAIVDSIISSDEYRARHQARDRLL